MGGSSAPGLLPPIAMGGSSPQNYGGEHHFSTVPPHFFYCPPHFLAVPPPKFSPAAPNMGGSNRFPPHKFRIWGGDWPKICSPPWDGGERLEVPPHNFDIPPHIPPHESEKWGGVGNGFPPHGPEKWGEKKVSPPIYGGGYPTMLRF